MARTRRLLTRLGLAALALVLFAASRPPAVAGPLLLLEPAKGEVLAAESPDESWYPASLTKLMTAYLTFEAVKSGKVAWDSEVPLSENARAQPATRIGLRGGIKINVEQAVRGLILRSANDFAMALAELIGGSEEGFAELQNATAKRLGMTRTRFKNPHGLPDPEQMTTARDMAILAAALLRDFPERAEVFSTPQVQIHRQLFHSQNDLLRTFEGADGMKTGFTCGAGYNVVASATRNGRQLVVVVLGALTRELRSRRAAEVLEAGFAHLEGKAKPAAPEVAEGAGTKPMIQPVALKDLAASHAEATPVNDMSKLTRTWKCGNRGGGPRPAVARAGKRQVAKAGEAGDAAVETSSTASAKAKGPAAKAKGATVKAAGPAAKAAAQAQR